MALRLTSASSQKLTYSTGGLDFNNPYTLLVAFRPTTVAASQRIIQISKTITDYDSLFIDSSQSFKFRWRSVKANVSLGSSISATIAAAATWYYLALVRYSTTSMEMFGGTTPNGMASINANNLPLTVTSCAGRVAATQIEVGGLVGSTEYCDGRFRYVRTYGEALTLAQIKVAAGPSLFSEYLLPDGTTLADTSGLSHGPLVASNGPATTEADDAVTWAQATNNRRAIVTYAAMRYPDPSPPGVSPIPSFTIATDQLSARFTETSSDPDGTVTGWLWDFGDGTTDTAQNPTHVYEFPGSYVVTLTVTDNSTLQGTTTATVVANVSADGQCTDITTVGSL